MGVNFSKWLGVPSSLIGSARCNDTPWKPTLLSFFLLGFFCHFVLEIREKIKKKYLGSLYLRTKQNLHRGLYRPNIGGAMAPQKNANWHPCVCESFLPRVLFFFKNKGALCFFFYWWSFFSVGLRKYWHVIIYKWRRLTLFPCRSPLLSSHTGRLSRWGPADRRHRRSSIECTRFSLQTPENAQHT